MMAVPHRLATLPRRYGAILATVAMVFGLMLSEASPAVAASIYVDCATDDLTAVIQAATPGSTLRIIGTCVGNFAIDRNLKLVGDPTATLDGNATGTTVTIVPSVHVRLTGLVITGGTEFQGGGIVNEGNLTIVRSTLQGNTATQGAGIFNGAGVLSISNSSVSGNVTYGFGQGGGIFNDTGSVSVSGSDISANASGARGGAIYEIGGPLAITTSTLSGNSSGDGGAIYIGNSTVNITRSTLSGNSGSVGGALYSGGGSVTISASTFAENSATLAGGGVDSGGTLSVSRSTFSGNTAGADGGGGIANLGSAILDSTIVAGNGSAGGPDCWGSVASGGSNLIGDTDGCGFVPASGDLVGSSSGSGVIDPLLGTLASGGGPTQTMALAPMSPAVDAIGVGSICPGSGIGDQRNVARPQGFACDIGAYELKAPWIAAVAVDPAAGQASAPVVSGTIVCNQGASFTVAITLKQGSLSGSGISLTGTCAGATSASWSVDLGPSSFSPGSAKATYTATVGARTKRGTVAVALT